MAASLACLLFAPPPLRPRSRGTDLTYHLYGSRSAGWGFTNTSLTRPGPLIEVEVGDNVTLNLTSVDGLTHVVHRLQQQLECGRVRAEVSNFGTRVVWNFTVSNVTGTFRYRSDRTAGPSDDLA